MWLRWRVWRKSAGRFSLLTASGAVRHQPNNWLYRKNGFARRAKLAQKLRWRKATKSNFCDKVFVGFELLVMPCLPNR